ncbi:MAG: glycosyltransferase family 4 protein [Candidatus Brocadia sp.]|nr:glycosyltransferase family 4 protein [Candidatus Brocadia sp.]
MNIAMIEPVCAYGGMDYYDYALCKSLLKAGQHVKLYTSDAGPIVPDNIDVSETFKGVFGSNARILRAFQYILAFRKSIADASRRQAKLAHFHFFDSRPIEKLAVWFANRWGLKTIATIHDIEPFHTIRSWKSISWLLSHLDGIIVHNEMSKIEISKFIPGQLHNIRVIPHGNYIHYIGKKIERRSARNNLNLPEGCPLILFFGQIKKVKGLDIAIRAIAVLRKTVPDARLLIAGRLWKDEHANYKALVKEMGIEDNIIWHHGYIPQDKVDSYYYASDAIVLPYRRIYQSGVLLMAMSYGIPVIASDLPGMKEVVKNEENGLLFPVDDHEILARTMARLINNVSFAKRLGQKGQDYVRIYHDWDTIGMKTTNFYKQVMGDK